MWNYKCPRCRKGDMYKEPFQLSNPLDMNEHCSNCGQEFIPEPGFYFGAMFLSYIFSAWFLLLPTLLLVFYYDWSVNAAMGITLLLAALIYLRVLRGSRALWLHLMVKYDKEIAERQEVSSSQ